jgi:hypothetical protein
MAGVFQWPAAGSYSNWRLIHDQTGTIVGGNNFGYATNYLALEGTFRGNNESATFYPSSYNSSYASFTVQVCPINGTVQINRDGASFSSMTIMEIKQ